MTAMSAINWLDILSNLDFATPSSDTDELIDEVIGAARQSLSQEALPVLIKALDLADSVFVKQRVALTLANIAPKEDISAVDALISCIGYNRHDEFLYIHLVKALGILARQNSFANAEILRILLRLKCTDSPYLLVQSVKIIGHLEQIRRTPGFRDKLTELEQSENLGVQAEVFQQEAILALTDALLSHDFDNLKEHLNESRVMFMRSRASEETREDAKVYILLLELILEFFNLGVDNRVDVVAQIQQKNKVLLELIHNPYAQSWYGYRSSTEQLIMIRILRISDAFTKIVTSVSTSEEWTNFDETLVELASLYILIRERDEGGLGKWNKAFSEVAPRILLPKLGPLVMKATGRARFDKVIQNHTVASCENEVAEVLRIIYDTALTKEYYTEFNFDPKILAKLANEAERIGESPDFFLNSLWVALESGEVEEWLKKHYYPIPALSIDHPKLFGNTPSVDLAVRNLLKEIRSKFKEYPKPQWSRLIETCESITQIVHQIRDELPLYTLRGDDEKEGQCGKGQKADERDLQQDLFRYLRIRYGSSAGYEISSIGGGRSDTGLKFSECEFPIECKAEYKTIERQHIHENYVAQADVYASVRDRVAFIIILDLRDTNSGRVSKKPRQKAILNEFNEVHDSYSLYSLKDSFWVDGLPGDPHLQNPQQNVAVVGLVPGNRPKPSSLTKYSRKPAG